MTLQSLQCQPSDDKDVDISSGIAGLNLESSGTVVTTTSPSTFEAGELRSSSAMAEYRIDGPGSARTSLPHSLSSPTLTVLNHTQGQTHLLANSAGKNAGFGSGAGSLAASQQNLKALLPAYRPAPDYETAVRIKYGDDIAKLLVNPTPPIQQATQLAITNPPQLAIQPSIPQPFQSQQQNSQQQIQMMKMYKPPPPYPYSKVGSNSSPDLVVSTNGVLPTSSGSMSHLPVTLAQTEISASLRNGEPIYQNIPLRQPGSQPNLSPSMSATAQSTSQPRRKWGLPVRNSARSAIINRVQTSSPSSSPSSKRNTNEVSSNPTPHGVPTATPSRLTDPTIVKDHLVSFSIFSFSDI